MCGILGVAGHIGIKEKKAFEEMLYTGALRGPHSTGIAAVDKDKIISLYKRAWHSFDFLNDKRTDKLINAPSNLLLGHNRWATKGGINHANAHPFLMDNLVGVHNGTLHGQWRLPDSKLFDVDSENIYHSFNEKGIDWTVENLEGAYALVWYDRDTNQLHMLRNKERDLYYAFTEDKKTLFWASEYHMLVWIAKRNGIALEQGYQLSEHMLTSFELPLGLAHNTAVFDKVRLRKLAPFVAPVYTGWQGVGRNHGGSAGNASPFPKKTTNIVPIVGDSKELVHKGSDFSRLSFLTRKNIVFSPLAIQRNIDGVSYWACLIDSDDKDEQALDIRIHLNYEDKHKGTFDKSSLELNALFDTGDIFEGEIKQINFEKEKPYGIIDRRTVIAYEIDTLTEEADDKPEQLYIGNAGLLLDDEGLARATHNGCAWCASPFTKDEADTITWVDDNTYVCEGCMEQDEVKQYTHTH